MITEDYINFETAKPLKEKGFDEYTLLSYDKNGNNKDALRPFLESEGDVRRPTLQMAMKWLREEKKLSIIIQICFDDDRNREPGYYFEIWQLTPPYESPDTPVLVFDTYEEASEAAIKYCLEKLI